MTGVGSASAPADLARVHLAATATRPAVADAVEVADAATRRLARAEQIAALAGRSLGPVRSVEEGERSRGRGRLMAAAMRESAAEDLDVEAGDVSVEVELRVRWELA